MYALIRKSGIEGKRPCSRNDTRIIHFENLNKPGCGFFFVLLVDTRLHEFSNKIEAITSLDVIELD
jgi:hypothetical protein